MLRLRSMHVFSIKGYDIGVNKLAMRQLKLLFSLIVSAIATERSTSPQMERPRC